VLVDTLPNSPNNMVSNKNCYTRLKMVRLISTHSTSSFETFLSAVYNMYDTMFVLQRSLSNIKGLPGEHVIPIEAFEVYEKWRDSDFIRNANNYLTMDASNLVIPHNSGSIGECC